MADNSSRLFWPQPIGPYESDLQTFLIHLIEEKDCRRRLALLQEYVAHLPVYPNSQESRLRFRAYLMVLSDLLRQQWLPEMRQGKLHLLPPEWSNKKRAAAETEDQKQVLRQALLRERKSQFEKNSVQMFIRFMEHPHVFEGRQVSIRSLLADGSSLANVLRSISQMEDSQQQAERIATAIRPYLQLVSPRARCAYTGFYLQDIWRYFRYTWTTPYNPTPGRQMFYLIRDSAQAKHPVIGIAALGSSVVQLTVRDDKIGWTSTAFGERLRSSSFTDAEAARIVDTLYQTLQSVLADLNTADLVTSAELTHPTLDTLARLSRIERESREDRISWLKRRHKDRALVRSQQPLLDGSTSAANRPDVTDVADPFDLAQEALFRGKRAGVLRQLLEARQALSDREPYLRTAEQLSAFWQTAPGQRAIKTLIRENKKRKVGINMMDIIVCGAIPPYNILLGGKLVAMLLASPEVVHDYEKKYSSYKSTIASRMKGDDVRRDARLVFLGTTSLYATGSSQYNRIALPVPNKPGEVVRYIKYGLTEGYGSVHFSEGTLTALDDLLDLTTEARLINNRFGEGVNPKLRRIRVGLTALGLLSVDSFIRHRSPRIVYGLPLGRRSYSFLRGETDDPDYYFSDSSESSQATATAYISNFWATRWLLSRIQDARFIEEVAAFEPERVLLSCEIGLPQQQAIQRAMSL